MQSCAALTVLPIGCRIVAPWVVTATLEVNLPRAYILYLTLQWHPEPQCYATKMKSKYSTHAGHCHAERSEESLPLGPGSMPSSRLRIRAHCL
jgi:hypothetical protein